MSRQLGATMVGLLAAALLSSTAQGALDAQRLAKHAALIAVDGSRIEDYQFAGWIRDALLTNDPQTGSSVRDVRDATFLFQQCFGGGMLDDLQAALNDKGITWVGGSASRYDEPSIGQVTPEEKAATAAAQPGSGILPESVVATPQDYWTQALVSELRKDQPLIAAIDAAGANDGANKTALGPLQETPQSVSAAGGDQITLKDAQAKSHHAILWAGDAGAMRHFNDVDNVRKALLAQWGEGNVVGGKASVTITVLFGDGMKNSAGDVLPAAWGRKFKTSVEKADAIKKQGDIRYTVLPATADNLLNEIQRLGTDRLDSNEQFFFYASDHGDPDTEGPGTAGCVSRGNCPVLERGGFYHDTFVLWQGELIGMVGQPDNVPTLSVSYTGNVASNAVSVMFNGEALGYLRPGVSTTEFPVLESGLSREKNLVRIRSRNAAKVTIQSVVFHGGSIDTNPLSDCNANLRNDAEDIVLGRSQDRDHNGVPDECATSGGTTRVHRPHPPHVSPGAGPTPPQTSPDSGPQHQPVSQPHQPHQPHAPQSAAPSH